MIGAIREKQDSVKMIHGNLIKISGKGLLITGPSGAGKTSCSLNLMKCGSRCIADDTVVLEKIGKRVINGRAHESTKGLLYLREKGIALISDYVEGSCIEDDANICLIAELDPEGASGEFGDMIWGFQDIMGVSIRRLRIHHHGGNEEVASILSEIVHRI
ncbi:MAG: HPr kinase/phosphatase C-terminal domain-containing protein [Syntrophales bacterium]|nr:HPr kinase/phosphatase C-terminal domain-containing protein [Syntrophales bacterium]